MTGLMTINRPFSLFPIVLSRSSYYFSSRNQFKCRGGRGSLASPASRGMLCRRWTSSVSLRFRDALNIVVSDRDGRPKELLPLLSEFDLLANNAMNTLNAVGVGEAAQVYINLRPGRLKGELEEARHHPLLCVSFALAFSLFFSHYMQ